MTALDSSTAESQQHAEEFFLWALASLQLKVESEQDGGYKLHVSEHMQGEFECSEVLRFSFGRSGESPSPDVRSARLGSPFWKRVVQCLRQLGHVVHAMPRRQPASVHQLAPCLFAHYDVQGGRVHLGGCSLDDHPLLRYTYLMDVVGGATAPQLFHVYRAPDGRPVDESLLRALCVNDVIPTGPKAPRVADEDATRWRAAGMQHAPDVAGDSHTEFLLATVIWCKFVQCKLLFEIGESRADLALSDWAQLLVDNVVAPPPFRCPATGKESYRLVTTDDGRITVPEAIAVCDESGRQVLLTELDTCENSGRRVLAEYLRTCPVTGARLLQSTLVACSQCRQDVDQRCLQGDLCLACRSLESVSHDDARMAQVLGDHPQLDRWSNWKLAETASVYVITARSFFRRRLVVVDRETLALRHVAEASLLSRRWTGIPPDQWEGYLK